MDFRATGWVYIVLGAFMLIAGAVELLSRSASTGMRMGRMLIPWGLGIILIGIAKLGQTSWSDPTPVYSWIGTGLIGVAAVFAVVNLRDSRRRKRAD
jgi:hypothetical protein